MPLDNKCLLSQNGYGSNILPSRSARRPFNAVRVENTAIQNLARLLRILKADIADVNSLPVRTGTNILAVTVLWPCSVLRFSVACLASRQGRCLGSQQGACLAALRCDMANVQHQHKGDRNPPATHDRLLPTNHYSAHNTNSHKPPCQNHQSQDSAHQPVIGQ